MQHHEELPLVMFFSWQNKHLIDMLFQKIRNRTIVLGLPRLHIENIKKSSQEPLSQSQMMSANHLLVKLIHFYFQI